MHIETNIDRHGENPNLGMQSWIENNEIERNGEYVCDMILNPNLRAYEHVIELKHSNHAKTKNNLGLAH